MAGEPGGERNECFPDPLRHPVQSNGTLDTSKIEEPIAADFRVKVGRKTGEGFTSAEAYRLQLNQDGSLTKHEGKKRGEAYESQLQQMKLMIIAGFLGVGLEQLRDRDKAYQLELARKRTSVLRRLLAAVGVLLILALAGGIISYLERQKAIKRSDQLSILLNTANARNQLLSSP